MISVTQEEQKTGFSEIDVSSHGIDSILSKKSGIQVRMLLLEEPEA